MSFSFSVQADSKEAAIGHAAVKLNEVVNQQPVHVHDARAIRKAIEGHVALLRGVTMNEVLNLSVSGWCSANEHGDLTSVNVSVGASIAARPVTADAPAA